MFKAEVVGIEDLERDWASACNVISQGVAQGVMKGVREGAEEIRSKHTFRNITGELEKSVEGVALGWARGGTVYEGALRALAKHASFVDGGTKPHVIEPRRKARWLSWENPQGDFHFAKRVNHPGTAPAPFMHLGFYKCERVIIREVELSVLRAQEILNR